MPGMPAREAPHQASSRTDPPTHTTHTPHLVGVVSCVEIGEDAHACLAGHLAEALDLLGGDGGVHGSVVLDGACGGTGSSTLGMVIAQVEGHMAASYWMGPAAVQGAVH